MTGLLESLRMIEFDASQQTALLRSNPPGQSEDGVQYYELLLRGDGQTLMQRFQGAKAGAPRRQIEFTLTHEAISKLIGDLTAA